MAEQAKILGISMLGLTDHNTTRNLGAFDECCRQQDILPLYGIEVTTREEIHVTCFFETLDIACAFGTFIESLLPDIPNNPVRLGDQVYVNAQDEILGEVEKSLYSACEITFEQLLSEVQGYNGLFIPAHIDRSAFSVTSQIGFLPDLPYSAVEVVRLPTRIKTYHNRVITNSDAHYLQHMGTRSWEAELSQRSFQALKQFLEQRL